MSASPHASHHEWVYLIDEDLEAVVHMAIKLDLPLLVTGEPGTGKTQLAQYIAQEIVKGRLITFNTKTTSRARDLLYHYNTLSHFRDSRAGQQVSPMDYIAFQGLGKAIIDSREAPHVVLVDEIDKAPRDFPNDVLFEFENGAFEVVEASAAEVQAHAETLGWGELVQDGVISSPVGVKRPFLLLTSNSEKNLPDAFLRRCAYYHILFPSKPRLKEILEQKGGLSAEFKQHMLDHAIEHFLSIRKLGMKKKPATAELLAWVHILQSEGIDLKKGLDEDDEPLKRRIRQTYSLLTKNREDRERLLSEMNLL